jgi:FtsH-binding integral membrane protein
MAAVKAAPRKGAVSEARINTFLAQVYGIMFIGLAVTALVSTAMAQNVTALISFITSPGLVFGVFLLQIFVVVALSAAVGRLNAATAFILFLFYAALTGVSISGIFLFYANETIYSVFWITALTFLITSVVALVMKLDMSKAGPILFMLLLGWSLAWMFTLFFPNSQSSYLLNFIGIALFVGLTAYDTQRLKKLGEQLDTHPARGGLAVVGALQLYLDFINLFLLILRASNRNK